MDVLYSRGGGDLHNSLQHDLHDVATCTRARLAASRLADQHDVQNACSTTFSTTFRKPAARRSERLQHDVQNAYSTTFRTLAARPLV